ncbi:hypothetical protein T06_3558, partial [Trichinella sp. T6]
MVSLQNLPVITNQWDLKRLEKFVSDMEINIRGLKTLKTPPVVCQAVLMPLILSRLPRKISVQWKRQNPTCLPTWTRCRTQCTSVGPGNIHAWMDGWANRLELQLTAEHTKTKSGEQFLMYHSPTNDILIFATDPWLLAQ